MLRLILGVVSILALAWWKRNIIQAFFDDWYARDVEIIVETESVPMTEQTASESAEESAEEAKSAGETEPTEEAEPAEDITVYVTASGTRYHQAGCRSIKGDAEAIPLSEAEDKYEPCSRCKHSV